MSDVYEATVKVCWRRCINRLDSKTPHLASSQTTLAVVGTVAYDLSNLGVGLAYGTSS